MGPVSGPVLDRLGHRGACRVETLFASTRIYRTTSEISLGIKFPRPTADTDGMYLLNQFRLFVALIAALTPSVWADDPGVASASGKPSAGLVMIDAPPGQYMPAWLQVGGQIRGRFEKPSGTSLLNSGSDAYYLSRIRVDLAVKPTRWLRLFVQAQDARVGAYNIAPASTTYYNPMDLRQAYVELNHE